MERVAGHKTLVSASSADVEFYSLLKLAPATDKPFDTRSFSVHEGLTIDILNGGYPVNFDRTKNATPDNDIVLTYSLMYLATMQAVELLSTNQVEGKMYNLERTSQKHLLEKWVELKVKAGEPVDLTPEKQAEIIQYSTIENGEEAPNVWIEQTIPAQAQKEYNEIASAYHTDATQRDDRKYLFVPSALSHLGDITGKTVADYATGSGYWARLLKKQGATRVVGVDISEEMLKIAQVEEQKFSEGIEYVWGDLRNYTSAEKFDLVFAAFLLNYNDERSALFAMCQSISDSLTPGGRFVTLTPNPDKPEYDGSKYKYSAEMLHGKAEGDPITFTNFDNHNQPISFTNYYWSKATYEEALRSAGFTSIVWHPLIVSEEGKQCFEAGYWDEYVQDQHIIVLECSK